MYVTATQVARAYLARLANNPEAELACELADALPSVSLICDEVAESLTTGQFGAPTEADVCHAILAEEEAERANLSAKGNRLRDLLTAANAERAAHGKAPLTAEVWEPLPMGEVTEIVPEHHEGRAAE